MARLKPDLAFALHAHQPAGNFNHVFEKITEESYLPFLEKFKQYPGAGKMGYHASGILYQWWEKYKPEMGIGWIIRALEFVPVLAGREECKNLLAMAKERKGKM